MLNSYIFDTFYEVALCQQVGLRRIKSPSDSPQFFRINSFLCLRRNWWNSSKTTSISWIQFLRPSSGLAAEPEALSRAWCSKEKRLFQPRCDDCFLCTYFCLLQTKMATGNVLSRGVFIVAAKRTAFGAFGGSLKSHTPVDLQVRPHFSYPTLLRLIAYTFRILSVCGRVL